MNDNPNKTAPGTPVGRFPARTPRVDSTELFRDADRIEITHRGETYRLQITRHGKLILTK